MPETKVLASEVQIEKAILIIRSEKVIFDFVLAKLYGVTTSALVQAVHRNIGRFPSDFMFKLIQDERDTLRSQIVISNPLKSQIVTSNKRGGERDRKGKVLCPWS